MAVNPPRSGPQQQIRGGSASSLHMGNPGGLYYPTVAQRPSAVLATIPVPVAVAGQPVNAPNFPIPSGYYVEVGQIPGNIQSVFYTTVSRQAAINGPREFIPQANAIPRQIDVRNLNEVWVNCTNNGDGVQFTIRKVVS